MSWVNCQTFCPFRSSDSFIEHKDMLGLFTFTSVTILGKKDRGGNSPCYMSWRSKHMSEAVTSKCCSAGLERLHRKAEPFQPLNNKTINGQLSNRLAV
jgi:hypothetical protein